MSQTISPVAGFIDNVRAKWERLSWLDLLKLLVLRPMDLLISHVFFFVAVTCTRYLPDFILKTDSAKPNLASIALSYFGLIPDPKLRGSVRREDGDNSITVLSHNIWYHFVAGGMWRRARMRVLIESIARHRPTVCVFQELFWWRLCPWFSVHCELLYLTQHLQAMGYKYRTRKPLRNCGAEIDSEKSKKTGVGETMGDEWMPPLGAMNHGLMIFSLCPVREEKHEVFEANRAYCRKGFQECVVEIGSNELWVVNTHFEHLKADVKRSQIEQLSARLAQGRDEHRWRLCCGDFNICSNDTWNDGVYPVLCESMRKVALTCDLFPHSQRTYRQLNERTESTGAYDHMFVSDQMHKRHLAKATRIVDYKRGAVIASDHLGIEATFKFP